MPMNNIPEQSNEMLRDSMQVLRNQLQEYITRYDTSKMDWNNNARVDISLDLAQIVPPLLILETFFAEMNEEE